MSLPNEIKKMIPLYSYRIEWSDEDKLFVVSIEELPGCMTHGKTQVDALKMGIEAVEGHLEVMYESKIEIPKPLSLSKYSGEFIVRVGEDLHRRIAINSNRLGYKSMNKFIVDVLKNKVDVIVPLLDKNEKKAESKPLTNIKSHRERAKNGVPRPQASVATKKMKKTA